MKFFVVGSTGFALDAGLTVLFLHVLDCGSLLARGISFAVVSPYCWYLNRCWTFAVGHRAHILEYGRYLATNLLVILLNGLIYGIMMHHLPPGIPATVLAVATGTVCGMGISFALLRAWVFRTAPAAERTE